jgi:hypothetical protein
MTRPLSPGELALVRAFLAAVPPTAPVSSEMARRLVATLTPRGADATPTPNRQDRACHVSA